MLDISFTHVLGGGVRGDAEVRDNEVPRSQLRDIRVCNQHGHGLSLGGSNGTDSDEPSYAVLIWDAQSRAGGNAIKRIVGIFDMEAWTVMGSTTGEVTYLSQTDTSYDNGDLSEFFSVFESAAVTHENDISNVMDVFIDPHSLRPFQTKDFYFRSHEHQDGDFYVGERYFRNDISFSASALTDTGLSQYRYLGAQEKALRSLLDQERHVLIASQAVQAFEICKTAGQ